MSNSSQGTTAMNSENGVGERATGRSIAEKRSVQGPERANGVFTYWIQEDDLFVTVKIRTESITGMFLFLSISARSVLLFAAPNKPEIHDDDDLAADDLLSVITISAEIDPDHAEVSLLGEQLVLVLPVVTSTYQILNAS